MLVGSLPGCVPPPRIAMRDLSGYLPTGLSLPAGAGLLSVDTAGGMTTVQGESTQTVTQLQDEFRRQVLAAGHDIFAEDNEGIEAELFFAVKGGGLATVSQRRARCPAGTTRFSITLN